MNKLHSSEDELFFYSDAPLQSGFPNVLFLYLGNHMYLLKIVELLKEIIGIHTHKQIETFHAFMLTTSAVHLNC